MPQIDPPKTHLSQPSWRVNPLKERDETLVVLDAWGDQSSGRGNKLRYGRWITGVLLVALCAWGASITFPDALSHFSG